MGRLIANSFIGALLVAPVGFGLPAPVILADIARMLFAGLVTVGAVLIIFAATWSRRWSLPR